MYSTKGVNNMTSINLFESRNMRVGKKKKGPNFDKDKLDSNELYRIGRRFHLNKKGNQERISKEDYIKLGKKVSSNWNNESNDMYSNLTEGSSTDLLFG